MKVIMANVKFSIILNHLKQCNSINFMEMFVQFFYYYFRLIINKNDILINSPLKYNKGFLLGSYFGGAFIINDNAPFLIIENYKLLSCFNPVIPNVLQCAQLPGS